MIPNKCGLDPLVECPEQEPTEVDHDERPILENEPTGSHKNQKATELQRKPSDENQRCRSRATPSKSTDGVRPKKCGSRLSLTSIFNFTGLPGYARERSRSGWSYSDDVNTTVAMTSVSANDIRSAVSGSVSSRRYRGSDTGSCMDGGSEICSDLLLPEEEEEIAEDKDTKHEKKEKVKPKMRECPLCASRMPSSSFPRLRGCQHRSCRVCLRQYIEISITENRVEVPCPECSSFLHPSDITLLVGDNPTLVEKYQQFSLRRFLLTETDARWCPAPDCGYAVIASKCAACPQLQCQREECGMLFCYHCKREWHNNQTCDEARRGEKRKSRNPAFEEMMRSSAFAQGQESTLKPGDVKACPRCRTYIVKMDDGSCNHMVCTMCNAEFCWLCLKEISDLHYLSPTGCTFWGKKPWTRKKKLLWQLGTLVGAPVGIALIAGLSIPGIIFGVPVFVGRKVHQRFKYKSKAKRRVLTATCVVGSLVVSPVMAVMAVGVGVPIMLAYVYGVVPLSLCRNGGCGLSNTDSDAGASVDEEQLYGTSGVGTQVDFSQYLDGKREEVVSIDPSINSALSVPNDGRPFRMTPLGEFSRRRTSVESSERVNYEEASVKAMNGSHHYDDKSLHTLGSGHEVTSIGDELASTKALAGSAMETKSLSESVYRHLAAKYVEKNCDVEDRSSAHDEHCEESRADDVPSSSVASSSTLSKHRPSSSGLRTCAIEHGEDVLLLSEEAAALLLNSASIRSSHSGSQAEPHSDVFKIRTWLDNMKQMVATDFPQEKPYEPTISRSERKLRRSGSGKSVQTLTTIPAVPISTSNFGASNVSMPETGTGDNVSVNSTSSKRRKRLGFFPNWFNKSK